MLHNIIAEAYFNTPGIKMMLQNIIFKYKRINEGAALNLEGLSAAPCSVDYSARLFGV